MGSAARKLRRAINKRREIKLEAEELPTLEGSYKAVTFGQVLRATGVAESPYLHLFDGSTDAAGIAAASPKYSDDPEGFNEFMSLGKRMNEAYIVLGVGQFTDEEGDVYDLSFSDESDDDKVSVAELKELYGNDAVQDIDDRIFLLSNGRPRPKVGARKSTPEVTKRFPANDGALTSSVQSVRPEPN
jgi:hypothetical protein